MIKQPKYMLLNCIRPAWVFISKFLFINVFRHFDYSIYQGCGAGQSPAPAPAPILLAPEPAPNYWLPAPSSGSRLLAPSSGSWLRLLASAPNIFISFHTYFFTPFNRFIQLQGGPKNLALI